MLTLMLMFKPYRYRYSLPETDALFVGAPIDCYVWRLAGSINARMGAKRLPVREFKLRGEFENFGAWNTTGFGIGRARTQRARRACERISKGTAERAAEGSDALRLSLWPR